MELNAEVLNITLELICKLNHSKVEITGNKVLHLYLLTKPNIIIMKHLLSFIIFCLLSLGAQSQTESGIVIDGGIGHIKTKLNPSVLEKATPHDIDYKYNITLGYRFRIHAPKKPSLFYDLDAGLGFKAWHSAYGQSSYEPAVYEANSRIFSIFANGTLNYSIYKGFSIGAGLQPTYYIRQDGENNKNNFDIPIIAKMAYRFKVLEIGISYKHGLANALKTNYLKSGKFREYSLYMWIPF